MSQINCAHESKGRFEKDRDKTLQIFRKSRVSPDSSNLSTESCEHHIKSQDLLWIKPYNSTLTLDIAKSTIWKLNARNQFWKEFKYTQFQK